MTYTNTDLERATAIVGKNLPPSELAKAIATSVAQQRERCAVAAHNAAIPGVMGFLMKWFGDEAHRYITRAILYS